MNLFKNCGNYEEKVSTFESLQKIIVDNYWKMNKLLGILNKIWYDTPVQWCKKQSIDFVREYHYNDVDCLG